MPFFRQTDCLAASLAVLMCLYAIAQPLAADWFYYQQDGLRLDWQPVSSVLRERMEKYDLVLSGEWMVASYYLDYPVVNTRLVSAEVLDQVPTPIWILADYGAERDMTPDLRRWTKERCSEIFADGYMYRGQWWDLRLLECPACVDK